MIIVTGAMGFIGSNLVGHLHQEGYQDLVVVDDFYKWKKEPNLSGKRVLEWVHRDLFMAYFAKIAPRVHAVFHLGARTDTISEDKEIFEKLNFKYSRDIWRICTKHAIPLIYASSAATYGDGQFGFKDDHEGIERLQPLNAYAASKHDMDIWALSQKTAPPNWYALKFFNVYGPNEGHKGRMASVVYHAFHQIRDSGRLKLFKSHHPEYKDGDQLRDFIYVKDVLNMIMDIFEKRPASGIYNVGTGKSRTFLDLGNACFDAVNIPVNIEYIDMPLDLREKYQYFTEADMSKWEAAGLSLPSYSLEKGVKEYIQQYLMTGKLA